MTPPTFATQRLDHLGIVAGICDRIDLIQTIDTFVGQTRRKVSVGKPSWRSMRLALWGVRCI